VLILSRKTCTARFSSLIQIQIPKLEILLKTLLQACKQNLSWKKYHFLRILRKILRQKRITILKLSIIYQRLELQKICFFPSKRKLYSDLTTKIKINSAFQVMIILFIHHKSNQKIVFIFKRIKN
jgi:hypothetical protein